MLVAPGQRHESVFFEPVLDAALRATSCAPTVPDALAGDKAYRAKRIRQELANRSIQAVIPSQSDEPRDEAFDRATYRRRNIVERAIGWLKQWRAVATRYDKLARTYLATLTLALIERSLRRAA